MAVNDTDVAAPLLGRRCGCAAPEPDTEGPQGSHQRTDFPKRDDENYLKHSLAYRTDGEPRIDYLDVVITRWPPKERVYGRKAS